MMKSYFQTALLLMMALTMSAPAWAAEEQKDPAPKAPNVQEGHSNTELAKKLQNPVADLISIPFQNNFNFNYGPNYQTQYNLNVEPVVPFHLTHDWNLVTRTIIPFINQPWPESRFGLGDINTTLFLSPSQMVPVAGGHLFWGVGPILQFPTASHDVLGSGKYAAGPAGVVGYHGKTWVLGVLANNLWSYAGDDNRPYVNFMTVQPFINYNLEDGWYLAYSPIITANWSAKSSQVWTVPLGGAVGKVFRVGKVPFNANLGYYRNVIRPDNIGPEYQIRFQIALLLPSF